MYIPRCRFIPPPGWKLEVEIEVNSVLHLGVMVYLAILFLQFVVLLLLSRQVHQKFFRLFFRLTRSKKIATWLMAILFLPGTLIHELAHFLMATVLLVPVGKLELMPEVARLRRGFGEAGLHRHLTGRPTRSKISIPLTRE